MQRIGYDADSGRYYFRDAADRSIWQGPVGAQFGELTKGGWSWFLVLPAGLTGYDGQPVAWVYVLRTQPSAAVCLPLPVAPFAIALS